MYKEYNFKNIKSKHYLNAGKNLSDIELKGLYHSLVSVNKSSSKQVDNLFLKEGLTLSELREIYASCVITLIQDEDSPFGFLMSPILDSDVGHILHGGLIIFNRNPGADFIAFSSLCNISMTYEKYGEVFATNISSTPSIIEVFSNSIHNVWPSPKANLKKTPKHYKKVLNTLKDKYIDRYFPKNSNVIINEKRFTMSSNSNDMGFSTNYYDLSRSNDYIFQSFCRTWINYEESEDIIQVGKINLPNYLLQKIRLEVLKMRLKTLKPKTENMRNSKNGGLKEAA